MSVRPEPLVVPSPLTVTPPGGERPIRPIVAGGLFVIALAMIGLALVVVARGWEHHLPMGYGVGLPGLVAAELSAASASAVGFLVVRRRPGNAAGWILLALGTVCAAQTLGLYASAIVTAAPAGGGLELPAPEPTLPVAGWLAAAAIQPASALLVGLLMFTFPDGRLISPAWRAGVAVLVGGAVLRFSELAFGAQPLSYLPGLPNAFALPGAAGEAFAASASAGLGLFPLLAGSIAAVASLLVRYRHADAVTRLQVRWFLLAAALLATTLVPLLFVFLFVDPSLGQGEILWVLFYLAASLFPLAVGTAIARYRLYDIDRIVNRTFVYGALTAILAGLFATSVLLSQKIFVALTGETSDLAIAATTLIVVTAYTPVRRRLESLSERFFRYDDPRFGEYQASLQKVLDVMDPDAAARDLLAQAVRGLKAGCGRVELVDGTRLRVVAETTTPCEPVLIVPIEGRDGRLGQLVLGARLDGRAYAVADVAALGEAARLVGRAIELVEGRAGATRRSRRRGPADSAATAAATGPAVA